MRLENLSKMAKNGDGIEEQFEIEEINIISEKDSTAGSTIDHRPNG